MARLRHGAALGCDIPLIPSVPVSHSDDQRCKDKYGKYWDQYCALVPYKIIPGIV